MTRGPHIPDDERARLVDTYARAWWTRDARKHVRSLCRTFGIDVREVARRSDELALDRSGGSLPLREQRELRKFANHMQSWVEAGVMTQAHADRLVTLRRRSLEPDAG